VIADLPHNTVTLTNEATSAPDDPNCFDGGRTVWYRLTPAADLRVIVDTIGSNYDTTLGVYTGGPGSLQEVACNDDHHGRQSEVRFNGTSGTTYYMMVGSLNTGVRGTLRLQIKQGYPLAANDDDADATVVDAIPFDDHVDASEATSSPEDPECRAAGQTVWYSLTPAEDTPLLVDTAGSNYDTVLGIYEETENSLSEIECVDDLETLQAKARFDAEAGHTYLMMVGAFGGEGADQLQLSVDVGPEALLINTRVSPRGTVNKFGVARVHGSVRCSRDARALVAGSIRQRHNGRVVSDFFHKRLDCGPDAEDWTLTTNQGNFHEGRAWVRIHSTAHEAGNPFGGSDSDRLAVRLR
jgi:hypothetical protein